MSATTQPFFIVSSGRSGTAMLHKALAQAGDVEMHHEYMVHIVQPLAVRRAMGLADSAEATKILAATYGAAVHYSTAPHWGDSSNKASWLIPELAALLPTAKFVHLVRDGRKAAGSYFRKLADECYDDRSTGILRDYAADPAHVTAPPPEKKYWWPLPQNHHPQAGAFAGYDQFQRICWHWAQINRVILASLSDLPPERRHFARLEDIQTSAHELRALYDFLNLRYADGAFALFARPHNVNRPEDRLLDAAQRAQFDAIAGETMARLGYGDRPEYVVKY